MEKIKVETKKSLSEIRDVLKYALVNSDSDKLLIKLMVDKVTCYDNGVIHVVLNPLGVKDGVPVDGAADRN